MKPLLKWVGNKFNQQAIFPKVKTVFEPFRKTHTFVEPFCGSLGMSLRVLPFTAILSDINEYLINFHISIAHGYNWERQYREDLSYRELTRHLDNPTAFYLVNKTSYNGLYRVNSNGGFNTPQDNSKSVRDVKFPDLKPYRNLYSECFQSGNYRDIQYPANSFIYCDPPYYGTFSQYSKNIFRAVDHIRMIQFYQRLGKPCIISNSAHHGLLRIYQSMVLDFEIIDNKQSFNRSNTQETLLYLNL